MPDITMCINDRCPRNKECFRYMAKPSSYQSYARFEATDCQNFIKIEPGDVLDSSHSLDQVDNSKSDNNKIY